MRCADKACETILCLFIVKMVSFVSTLAAALVFAHGVAGFQSINKIKSRLPTLKMASEDHEFTVAILGDLHLDPRYMEDHVNGKTLP